MEYKKDFDDWSKKKKQIEKRPQVEFFHSREIWRCSLGVNIGSEQDGKNNLYERPVLVLKRFSKNTLLILPLTRKKSHRIYSYKINDNSYILLSQIRLISSKRLLRKTFTISRFTYVKVFLKLIIMILH